MLLILRLFFDPGLYLVIITSSISLSDKKNEP